MQYSDLIHLAIKLIRHFPNVNSITKAKMLSAAEGNIMALDEYREIIHLATKEILRHE